jgi:hypothetical protein
VGNFGHVLVQGVMTLLGKSPPRQCNLKPATGLRSAAPSTLDCVVDPRPRPQFRYPTGQDHEPTHLMHPGLRNPLLRVADDGVTEARSAAERHAAQASPGRVTPRTGSMRHLAGHAARAEGPRRSAGPEATSSATASGAPVGVTSGRLGRHRPRHLRHLVGFPLHDNCPDVTVDACAYRSSTAAPAPGSQGRSGAPLQRARRR